MPFISIELPETLHFSLSAFAVELHHYLSKLLSVPIEKCKTKLIRLPDVVVGNGSGDVSYARLKIECMAGRDRLMLINSGKELIERFACQIKNDNPSADVRITVEFHEIDRDLLFSKTAP
jgi:5-carboxymethyl-2-hydroxymuconate isomerase